MAQPVPVRPTFDELYDIVRALPQGVTGEVLVPGTLRTMGRPGRSHRRAVQRLFDELGGIDRARRGSAWWIEIEPEIRLLGDRLLVPDLAGWRVARAPTLPEQNPISLAPDWVAEILSPSTRRDDRHLKLPLYVDAGVPSVWLVDPEDRLVEAFAANAGRPVLVASAAEDETCSLPPFDLPMGLTAFWHDPKDSP